MSDSDNFEQKRWRLRNRLGIGLCIHGAALFIFQSSWIAATRLIPDAPFGDSWCHAMQCTWVIASIICLAIALTNASNLMDCSIVSCWMQIHAASVWIVTIFSFLLLDTMHSTPFAVATYVVSLYCIIPQIFLWRRLGKTVPNNVDL